MPYKLISLAVLIILLFACKKDEQVCFVNICGDWEHYTSTAILNSDNNWNANYCYFEFREDGSLRITLMKTNAYQHKKEYITIQLIDRSIGLHKLSTGSILDLTHADYSLAIFLEGDYDLSGARYYLIEEEGVNNYLSLAEISPDSSEISGTYNLLFRRSENGPGQIDQSIPDTLHFTNGVFRARKWR